MNILGINIFHEWNIDKSKSYNKINKIIEKAQIYNSIRVNERCKIYEPKNFDTINTIRYLIGCSLNLKPFF